MEATVYILRCADGSYYTGLTKLPIEARVWEHNNDPIDGYTARRRPVQLVFSVGVRAIDGRDCAGAADQGARSRAKKEALMRGDYDGASRPIVSPFEARARSAPPRTSG